MDIKDKCNGLNINILLIVFFHLIEIHRGHQLPTMMLTSQHLVHLKNLEQESILPINMHHDNEIRMSDITACYGKLYPREVIQESLLGKMLTYPKKFNKLLRRILDYELPQENFASKMEALNAIEWKYHSTQCSLKR